jgi:hypothetical protein
MRRLTRVDLPVPDGPDRTIGRRLEEMEALCVVVVVVVVGSMVVGKVLATGADDETNRGRRGCEMNDDVLEAVESEPGAIIFGLGENGRLGQAPGLGFRRIMKLSSRVIWKDLI